MFCAASSGDIVVFGTVTRGAVIKNFRTGATDYLNTLSGMQNNTVLNASFDRSGNMILCLDNGIDYAIYNSPVTILIGTSSSIGAGYKSLLFGSRMYFGTNQGLYSSPYPFVHSPEPLSLQRDLQGQVWDIYAKDGDIFASTDAGLFAGSGDYFYKVDGLQGTYSVQLLGELRDLALASTYNKFHLLRRQGSTWIDAGAVEGYDDIGGRFVQDNSGYIWHSHWHKGVYRLRISPDGTRFTDCQLLTTADGFPDNNNITVSLYRGRPVFATPYGFYTFDYQNNRVIPEKELAGIISRKFTGALSQPNDGTLISANIVGIEIAHTKANARWTSDSLNLHSVVDKLIPGYIDINYISSHEMIVSNQNGFWCVNPDKLSHRPWEPKPFISRIYANRDSVVYRAPVNHINDTRIQLPYELNSLRFDFGYPSFIAKNNVEFSSLLEDYDEDWTPYTSESSREFTQLSEGTYTFRLRAHDLMSGTTTETSFTIRIFPPWYRTIFARLCYAVLIVLTVVFAYKSIKRRVLASKVQLEKRKEQELADLRRKSEREALEKDFQIANLKSQQLKQDIKHKSNELSSSTMNLIRKNEILSELAAKIAKIQSMKSIEENAPEARKMLGRLLKSIEENISHDDDWKTFTDNFDIVYENYTKRLMELHPNLTIGDKRICCYIKMGLSSKEIAPLINISYKSVEMARYRLRKKMNLDSETSLADYLKEL